ncbi:hypothetical protein E4U35_003148 [Claviceps purpurea]|nr:hypothetical protein E4U35_003148 [Claviceps purpurea]
MDANTNPGTHPSLRQPDFGAVADISRGCADRMDRYRNLPAVQDGAQWAELLGRMGNFEGKIENLDTKVQNLGTKIQQLDTNIQRLEAKVDARMDTLENRMGALETGIRTLQTNMTTLETNIINKLDTFMALMTPSAN